MVAAIEGKESAPFEDGCLGGIQSIESYVGRMRLAIYLHIFPKSHVVSLG